MRVARPRRLEELLATRRSDLVSRFAALHHDVRASGLRMGREILERQGLEDSWLAGKGPFLPPYGSHVHHIENATIVSPKGVVVLASDEFIEDTADHTTPGEDGYTLSDGTMSFAEYASVLDGKYLSLLMGSYENHFHWLLGNVCRLSICTQHDLSGLDGILIPGHLSSQPLESLELCGAGRIAPLIPVYDGEILRVGTLVLPWNVASGFGINPDIMPFLRSWVVEGNVDVARGRRVYVDRRRAHARRLLNEDDIIRSIIPLGFEIIATEQMSLREQIDLFSQASLVVGPHGAGLTNIVFMPQGGRVIELMPIDRINWCYRNVAAVARLDYDAVFGRLTSGAETGSWIAPPMHLVAAINDASRARR